jgi:hypothetical protein
MFHTVGFYPHDPVMLRKFDNETMRTAAAVRARARADSFQSRFNQISVFCIHYFFALFFALFFVLFFVFFSFFWLDCCLS